MTDGLMKLVRSVRGDEPNGLLKCGSSATRTMRQTNDIDLVTSLNQSSAYTSFPLCFMARFFLVSAVCCSSKQLSWSSD